MIQHYFEILGDKKVKCTLCPRNCILKDGVAGYCRIRRNRGGTIINESYRLYSGISFDPIEKKPLYHFFPGRTILSVGSVGCNMRCRWCQNFEISQTCVAETSRLVYYTPDQLLELALRDSNNIGIAFTYNEPTINIESIIEAAENFKLSGLKTVLVTNGYVSPKPLKEYLDLIDAFNVDVKAFDEPTHIKYTGAKLQPVMDNLIEIKKSGKHLELTCLIVPGISDNNTKFQSFISWIVDNLGDDIPLHLSRYYPKYKLETAATSENLIVEFCTHASAKLKFVYAGNVHSLNFENTKCPQCQTLIIQRNGYYSKVLNHIKDGKCSVCGSKIFVC